MQLNLESARISREVEERIKAELRRLPATEQKFVLERVAVDVLTALSKSKTNEASTAPRKSSSSDTASDDGEKSDRAWQVIATYCRTHPTANGEFHNVAVAEALFPEKMKTKLRNSAISAVFTATKRRSVGASKDPYFVLLGDAKFRLATVEERSKTPPLAQSKRSLA